MPVAQKEHETLKHCLELTGVKKTVTLLKRLCGACPDVGGRDPSSDTAFLEA